VVVARVMHDRALSAWVLFSATSLATASIFACGRDMSASPGAAGSAAAPSSAASTASAGAAPSSAQTPPAPQPIPAPADVGAPPADAAKTASGLATKVLAPGTGKDHPGVNDRVKVHYTGWTKDGQMFDSSVARGEPITFAVRGVIPGWTEGLQLMVVGEKRRLWIPASLAYGERPRAGAPAGDLVFDVELLDVTVAPKPPPVPEDVKGPPASARKTPSGLAYRVLAAGAEGAGATHPAPTSTVTVNYSGWTPDGKMFDSSIVRGQPAQFRLDNVIKGWTEGVALMTKGEKARFWIPGALAYGDKPTRPGAPAGMLVFDIELIDFR
jgi:FKBP-type peptidyl-prolyl cis-trans isomerase